MDHDRLIGLLLEAATLKRMPRTGWGMRGVPNVESVAEHSFGTAFVALALAEALSAETQAGSLDVEQVLIMALLHDLAEVRLTDLPVSAVRLIPPEVKSQAEAAAVSDLLAPLPAAGHLAALWQAFEDSSSPEGRLVRDADKLEMMVQCLRYEQAGCQGLDEFWQAMDDRRWHYDLSAILYRCLKSLRPGSATASLSPRGSGSG
jgi:5'-deoxynucleotidase YfbR-like HD superfamily hydrolase